MQIGDNSPWGVVDFSQEIVHGVFSVATPSHGGIVMLTQTAKELLTVPAVMAGRPFGLWTCFEEDCKWAVPVWDSFAIGAKQALDAVNRDGSPMFLTNFYQMVFDTLKRWEPEYLKARHYDGISDIRLAESIRVRTVYTLDMRESRAPIQNQGDIGQ